MIVMTKILASWSIIVVLLTMFSFKIWRDGKTLSFGQFIYKNYAGLIIFSAIILIIIWSTH